MNLKNLFLDSKFDFLLDKNFRDLDKNQSYLYEDLFIQYQKEYNNHNTYKNISFKIINKSKNEIFFPATIEDRNNHKSLNFFGMPINIEKEKIKNFDKKKELSSIFINLLNENNINFFFYKSEITNNDLATFIQNNKNFLECINIECYINLNENYENIKKKFSKGHKSLLKKNYPNLEYQIFDHQNYKKNQILEMESLHELVSGKKTRSHLSWKINEKMIENDQGVLIKVIDRNNNKNLSYCFIYFNQIEAIYFSSCSLRESFKIYKNITHKVIWKAIQYLKNRNLKKFHLGVCKTLYQKKEIEKKQKNIELFKSSFGGEKKIYAIFNQYFDQFFYKS